MQNSNGTCSNKCLNRCSGHNQSHREGLGQSVQLQQPQNTAQNRGPCKGLYSSKLALSPTILSSLDADTLTPVKQSTKAHLEHVNIVWVVTIRTTHRLHIENC
jgi:hypothetical protein